MTAEEIAIQKENVQEAARQGKIGRTKLRALLQIYEQEGIEGDWVSRIIESRKGTAVTKKKLILKYGERLGTIRWDSYCQKQSITNTFEFKHEKYGWTKEQFEEYNKSRAVTKKLCVERHGSERGLQIWESYRNKQKHAGCSLAYFQEKYGKEDGFQKYKDVNKKKAITLENLVGKYGEELGKQKYLARIRTHSVYYSKVSQRLFWRIYGRISEDDKLCCQFGEKGGEFWICTEDGYRFFDFVIPSIKFCIEFNGDIYHANPKLYGSADIARGRPGFCRVAQDLWDRDKIKNAALSALGYEILIVWEKDFAECDDLVVERCVDAYKKRKKDFQFQDCSSRRTGV